MSASTLDVQTGLKINQPEQAFLPKFCFNFHFISSASPDELRSFGPCLNWILIFFDISAGTKIGNNIKDFQLKQLIRRTIIYADKDKDGKISFVIN